MKSLKSLLALAPALALAAFVGCNDDTMDDSSETMPPNPTTPTPAPPINETDTGLDAGMPTTPPTGGMEAMPNPTTPGEMEEMPEPTPPAGEADAPPLDPSTPPVIDETPSEPTEDPADPGSR